MEAFFGSWKLVSVSNFDEYMEAIGFSQAMRHYGNNISTVVIFSQDGDNIVMKTNMYGIHKRSVTVSFKLGEEIDEHSVDFRFCKTVFNLEEGKLVQLQKWDDKEATTIREIQDGKLITTLIFGDVVSVRTYEST